MWKILGIVVVSLMFFVHCGSDVSSFAFSQEAAAEGEIQAGLKDAAITAGGTADQKAVVAVDAGYAGNGTTVSIPSGFTAAQCKFTAAAANIDGSSISTTVSINHDTGEVVCEKIVQERIEIPAETKDCVASYTVICVREEPAP